MLLLVPSSKPIQPVRQKARLVALKPLITEKPFIAMTSGEVRVYELGKGNVINFDFPFPSEPKFSVQHDSGIVVLKILTASN